MYAYFDLAALAAAAGVSDTRLRELETCIREQYGSDEMLIELRLLRTLHAIGEGGVSEADAIRELGGASTGGAPVQIPGTLPDRGRRAGQV